MRTRHLGGFLFVLFVFAICSDASAVILYAKRLRNTSAPTGSLAGSGWDLQGQFRSFPATPIGKKDFLTASHIGGSVGDYLYFGERKFKTISFFDDPLTDLRIWRVQKAMPTHAALYAGSAEVGKPVMIFGRGTARGAEVRLNGVLKGWRWRDYDFVQSWGQNVISRIAPAQTDAGGEIPDGHIAWTFDRDGIGNEGILSDGDSGGGVFINDGNVWKLAGINHAVDENFKFPGSSDVIHAALFDAGGMIAGDDSFITDTLADVPAQSYASRISVRMPWITDVLSGRIAPSAGVAAMSTSGVPEPGMMGLIAFGLMGLIGRRNRR